MMRICPLRRLKSTRHNLLGPGHIIPTLESHFCRAVCQRKYWDLCRAAWQVGRTRVVARVPRKAAGHCLPSSWAADHVLTFERAENNNVEKALSDNSVGDSERGRHRWTILPVFYEPCHLHVHIFGADSFMLFSNALRLGVVVTLATNVDVARGICQEMR